MAWYRAGTVSVTNGSAVVYGSGTLWVDAGVLNPGDIWTGPDGKLYEILSIQSNTQLTLVSVYLGTTASGQGYAIMPIGLLPSALALQVKSTLTAASAALTSVLKYDASQTLTTQQKTNVRGTIGLATMATQAANSVAITGGSITGVAADFSEMSFSTAATLVDLDLNNATTKSGLFSLDSTSTYQHLPAGFASPGRAYVDVIGTGAYVSQTMHQMSDNLPSAKVAYRRLRGSVWTDFVNYVFQGDDLSVASLLSTGAIGYGTGAGGTVVQATSKASTVTLNKVSGKLTMHAAALAAGTGVSFLFNNSSLAATDTLALNLLDTSIASPLNYQVWASVRAGAAVICLLNRSGGSLSEAVAINFNVEKGVTS